METPIETTQLGPWRPTDDGRWYRQAMPGNIGLLSVIPNSALFATPPGWYVDDEGGGAPLAHGPETGQEGRDLADMAARARGWVLRDAEPCLTALSAP